MSTMTNTYVQTGGNSPSRMERVCWDDPADALAVACGPELTGEVRFELNDRVAERPDLGDAEITATLTKGYGHLVLQLNSFDLPGVGELTAEWWRGGVLLCWRVGAELHEQWLDEPLDRVAAYIADLMIGDQRGGDPS